MYDNTFPASPLPEPPPPEPEVRKHSPLGIASFVLSIISLGLVCLFFIFAYVLVTNTSMASSSGVVSWVFICGIGLSTLVGVGLGIAAVVKPAQSKVFGILGIIFNALIMLGFCILILFAVFAAASVLGY